MSLVVADRVLETCTAPGTGAVTLLGPETGYQAFSTAVGNANTTYYTIADQSGSNWEVGLGTYSLGPNSLTRTTVLSSSNGGSLVNFNAGTQNVFVTYPSEKAVSLDATSTISAGSMLYGNGTTSYSSLAIGTNGYLLQSNGSAPTWVAQSTLTIGTTTNLAGGATGSVPYQSGSGTTTFLAAGTNGQVLTLAGGVPTWATNGNGTVTSVDVSGGTTGLTTSGGPITASGTITLAGTLATTNGGTGLTSFTSGGAVYATSTSALTTGTLPTTAGGTGLASFGANQLFYASSTSAVAQSNKMLFNGTNLLLSEDLSVNTLTVGLGGGSQALNTAVGNGALDSNTTGNYNSAVGFAALTVNDAGNYNAAFGSAALGANTTGSYNTAIGSSGNVPTLTNGALGQNTTGNYNTAVGTQALATSTTASNNTAVGYQAGYLNATGANNQYIGYQAGYTNATGSNNVCIGYAAGYSLNSDNNTCVGNGAGTLATGALNCYVGRSAGNQMLTGSNNTILGSFNGNQGGLDIRTANNYIVLSDGAGNPRGFFTDNGSFVAGGLSFPSGSNDSFGVFPGADWKVQVSRATTAAAGQILFHNPNGAVGSVTTTGSTTQFNTSSDYRLKEDVQPMQNALATVAQLNPVTYKWKVDGADGQGFIAHELQEVVPECVTGEKDAVDEDGKPVYQAIDASFLIATLTKAIQELSAKNDALEARIAALEAK